MLPHFILALLFLNWQLLGRFFSWIFLFAFADISFLAVPLIFQADFYLIATPCLHYSLHCSLADTIFGHCGA